MSSDPDRALFRPVHAIHRRFTESRFWAIQAAVLTITLVHIAMEGGLLAPGLEGGLEAAHHLPVVLYIAPVAYAGLSYGWEGGVLTGLWVGVLSSINIVAWHLGDFEWITELTFVLVVITLGVVLSIPVERERWQRTRAEAAAQRLDTINQVVAAAPNPSGTPAGALEPALRRLVRLLDLKEAGIVLWRRGDRERVVEAEADGDTDLLARYEDVLDGEQPGGVDAPTPSIRVISVDTDHMRGHLLAEAEDYFDQDEDELLVTIAHELAVRAENAMLVSQEQEMLTTYVRLATKAQEEERRRLARDLHDGTAQQLAMLVRDLKRHEMDADDLTGALHEEASQILEEVRRVARDQRPPLLDDLGLPAALEWLVDQAKERHSTRVELTVIGSVRRLPAEVEVALYRVAQEALRNAERHARAELIQLTLAFERDLVLSIEDDGRGFDVPSSAGDQVREGRLGLMGMQERSQLIGGKLEIHSTPGHGTTVIARVTLDEVEEG